VRVCVIAPSSHLPLNPILYLTLAIDSIAPLMRIRSQRGAAGGGVALQIPVPLGLRQRRRTAAEWILEAASKRKSRGSGRDMFALRVAEEIVAIVEGRSAAWEKRTGIHRIATTARSNLGFGRGGGRR
jgi:small subunit ribosomal protein S7